MYLKFTGCGLNRIKCVCTFKMHFGQIKWDNDIRNFFRRIVKSISVAIFVKVITTNAAVKHVLWISGDY